MTSAQAWENWSRRQRLIPDNDDAIRHMIDVHPLGPVVCAWGAQGGRGTRAGEVYDLLLSDGVKPRALGLTMEGQPRHPLYLQATTVMRHFCGLLLKRAEVGS